MSLILLCTVPSPPQNVRTNDITSTSVTLIWDTPQNPNGWLIGYKISYTSSGGSPTAVDIQNTTSWKLTDMKPYTSYSLSVSAKMLAGFGEMSIPVKISTLESGMFIYGFVTGLHIHLFGKFPNSECDFSKSHICCSSLSSFECEGSGCHFQFCCYHLGTTTKSKWKVTRIRSHLDS